MIRTDDSPTTRPRQTALGHETAMRLAATEYGRTVEAWAALAAGDWQRPTDCPDWTVQQLAAHVYGMARMAASPLEMFRQQKAAAKQGGGIDAVTAHQVDKFGSLRPGELVEAMREAGPRAARSRRRVPAFVRARTMPERQVVDGVAEAWKIGFIVDVILTRDPWMHRVDLARATGREMALTADHDGVIVDDVVREWAGRHGRSYRLELTGPAGGAWSNGQDGEAVEMDAVEFCRVISGREEGVGLLATQVPF